MKRCKIEIALKARPRLSLLVAAAAAVTLSGAFFSAQAQEPIKIGFGVSLTGGLASSGKAHLMSKQIWAEEINAKGGLPDQARLLRRPDQRRDRARHLREADRRR